MMGAYSAVDVVEDCQLILASTGNEISFCVAAAQQLASKGIPTRVVSMPCQEAFLQQSTQYKLSVLAGDIPMLSVNKASSSPHGWHAFSMQITMHSFGASGSGNAVFEYFGCTPDNIATKGQALWTFTRMLERSPISIYIPSGTMRPKAYIKYSTIYVLFVVVE